MPSLLLIFSILPLVVFLLLFLHKKTTLLVSSLVILLLTEIFAVFYWKILTEFLLFSLGKGFLIAFDIFIIIFGAVFFLEILKEIGVIGSIGSFLESISGDYRVQVILLAWFLENFLEGTAGFGTPGMIVAPVLVALGLPPVKAVIIALLGNSSAGIFGAAGTPIRIGFAGLSTEMVPRYSAQIACLGFLVPVFILWVLVSGEKERKTHFLEALPFAVWSGIAFVIPSLLSVFLGQEFPSILGAVFGIILILITTKLKLFLPKKERSLGGEKIAKSSLPLYKTILPYAALILLLVIGKFIFGSSGIKIVPLKHTIAFFNPGWIFLLIGLPIGVFWGKRKTLIADTLKISFKKAVEPFLVIAFMAGMVQLMINSGSNSSGLPSSLEFISKFFENSFLPFLAPFLGALGCFLTGSITISNIMFGNFMQTAGQAVGFNAGIILSLQLVGAAFGNMIALADILAAETVVHLHNEEHKILKGLIVPCLIFVFLVGIIGLLIAGKF